MKLFAFDLDGTTLKEHIHISEKNQAALQLLHEKNIVLVPSTGRILNFIPESILSLPGVRYLITSNGAAVYDCKEKKQIYDNAMPSHKAVEIQKILDKYDVYMEYYHEGKVKLEKRFQMLDYQALGIPSDRIIFFQKQYEMIDSYLEELTVHGMKPEKINLPFIKSDIYEALWQDLQTVEGIHLTSSVKGNIEINDISCHKGNALKFLSDYLHMIPKDVMAIGDNGNDIEMLAFAGISVAMGNATPEAKQIAKYETDNCSEDGLATAITRFSGLF
ncbi:HAD family hydrolase [Scatolibacter rhodanostii]|uniref:HAD family hydrolase n=1 Tax=Scatolibacter rhodanostii TaxID=2014781 RepID=UPI00135646C2|nr:HAD family hydrolase [Scatolibacter rhodanostii]